MPDYTITLDENHLNIVGNALSGLTIKEGLATLNLIQTQVNAQLQAAQNTQAASNIQDAQETTPNV